VEVYLYAFLISALDGGEWIALCPGRYTTGQKAPDTHWIGVWAKPVWTWWRTEEFLDPASS